MVIAEYDCATPYELCPWYFYRDVPVLSVRDTLLYIFVTDHLVICLLYNCTHKHFVSTFASPLCVADEWSFNWESDTSIRWYNLGFNCLIVGTLRKLYLSIPMEILSSTLTHSTSLIKVSYNCPCTLPVVEFLLSRFCLQKLLQTVHSYMNGEWS